MNMQINYRLKLGNTWNHIFKLSWNNSKVYKDNFKTFSDRKHLEIKQLEIKGIKELEIIILISIWKSSSLYIFIYSQVLSI